MRTIQKRTLCSIVSRVALAGGGLLVSATLGGCGGSVESDGAPEAALIRRVAARGTAADKSVCSDPTESCDPDGDPDLDYPGGPSKPTCPLMWTCDTVTFFSTATYCNAHTACAGSCFRDHKCSKSCYCP